MTGWESQMGHGMMAAPASSHNPHLSCPVLAPNSTLQLQQLHAAQLVRVVPSTTVLSFTMFYVRRPDVECQGRMALHIVVGGWAPPTLNPLGMFQVFVTQHLLITRELSITPAAPVFVFPMVPPWHLQQNTRNCKDNATSPK